MVSCPKPKKQRVYYGQYDAKARAEIAKWGINHGIHPAARKFHVPESTVQGIIKSYEQVKEAKGDNVSILPRKSLGGKPMLPEKIDNKVVSMINSMRAAGSVVSYNIAITRAKGIIIANDRTLLKKVTVLLNSTTHGVSQYFDI